MYIIMKRVLVISDTHGDISAVQYILDHRDDMDLIVHAGDTYSDMIEIYKTYGIPFEGVRGNTDFTLQGKSDSSFMIEDIKVYLTHGHKYGVKQSVNKLYYKGLEAAADIVIFGHTHLPYRYDGDDISIINPGSISRPRNGNNISYGILDVENSGFNYEQFYL